MVSMRAVVSRRWARSGRSTAWAPEGAAPAAVDLEEARALLDQAGVDPESLSTSS